MRSANPSGPDPFTGMLVDGRYKLQEPIGDGAMGTVYRATQVRVNRPVAVKLLRPEFGSNERVAERFEREALAIGRLNHPGCITLFDYGYAEETEGFFMVTELVGGVTLDRVGIALDPPTIMRLGFEIADALNHAHAGGIVHRDLKPGNVMIVEDDVGRLRAKVLDFGLALLIEPGVAESTTPKRRLTVLGEIHGSPRYMSPEQCRGELDVGPAADVYSLGVILYELFTGRVPFNDEAVPAILLSHLHDEVPDLADSRVSADVEQLLYEMLAKDPGYRPSVAEIRDVLARHVDLPSSGDLHLPSGLVEDTLDSDAYDDALNPEDQDDAAEPPDPETWTRRGSGSFELLSKSEDARKGAALGAFVTVFVVLAVGAAVLALT